MGGPKPPSSLRVGSFHSDDCVILTPALTDHERRQSLWKHFVAEWRPIHRQLRQGDFEKQRQAEKQRLDLSRRQYQAQRRTIQNNTGMKSSQRRAALSVVRMEKGAGDLALRTRADEERKALKSAYQLKPADEFRAYLADR